MTEEILKENIGGQHNEQSKRHGVESILNRNNRDKEKGKNEIKTKKIISLLAKNILLCTQLHGHPAYLYAQTVHDDDEVVTNKSVLSR